MQRKTELRSLDNADFTGLNEKELGDPLLPEEGTGTIEIRKII